MRKFNLKSGILLTYGSNRSHEQFVNFDNPKEANFLEGTKQNVTASKFSAGLMLVYIHNFNGFFSITLGPLNLLAEYILNELIGI